MTTTEKLTALVALLLRRPEEFRDRVSAVAEVQLERLLLRQPTYPTTSWDEAARDAGWRHSEVEDSSLIELERQTYARLTDRSFPAPFRLEHAADRVLARACYTACTALKPDIVVETGVAYGVTSAYILQALERNGRGVLHSIDLPPLARNAPDFVGIVVPDRLRHRWTLHRGTSRRLLPGLVLNLGRIDMFVHDSLHTYWNMVREFQTIWPYLRIGGVLVADDIQGNSAFARLVRWKPSFIRAAHEEHKSSIFGIAVK